MDLKVVIAFLSGSLGTLIIKEIFNLINRKVDFKRDIKKLTYIRKLEKAECAIAFYSTYLTTLIEMKKSFELLIKSIKEDVDLDIEIIQNILNQNSVLITDLMTNKYPESNAVHLYFDLENEDNWNETDLSNLLENLAETKDKDSEIQYWLGLYNSHLEKGNKEKAEIFWRKTEEMMPIYAESLQKVVDSFEQNKIAIRDIIKEIKKQL